jgi:hypothetical protein
MDNNDNDNNDMSFQLQALNTTPDDDNTGGLRSASTPSYDATAVFYVKLSIQIPITGLGPVSQRSNF